MSDVEKYADELVRVSKAGEEFAQTVRNACGGSFGWGVKEIVNSFKSLFDRFCPYKPGDRVELNRTPKSALDPTSGWYCCRHFLVDGAKGTVHQRGYSFDQFCFDVVFDNESWIGDKGVVHPMEENHKHTYRLGENDLRLSEEE